MAEEPDKKEPLAREAREKTLGFIIAALGFVAGLAWNDAVQALINKYIHLDQNSVLVKFLYAAGITLVAVILIIYLQRLTKDKNK